MNMSHSTPSWSRYLDAAFAFAILSVLAFVFVHDIPTSLDVGLYDESYYLFDARKNLFPTTETLVAPSYALWYRLLSFVFTDHVQLYFANWQILSVTLPLAVFSVLIAYRVQPIIALCISTFILYVSGNLPLRCTFSIWRSVRSPR